MSWLDRLKTGLKRTQQRLVGQVTQLLSSRHRIDEELLEELEAILIGADLGTDATLALLDRVREEVRQRGLQDPQELLQLLADILRQQLRAAQGSLALRQDGQPTVFLVLGVNGSGKTTTIAKLAQRFRSDGRARITLAAADTFRAAAIEQLAIWAERTGAKLIKHRPGADPSAVAYDATDYALNHGQDMLLIDTAGRLHTKHNLMEELKKINRVVEKRLERPIDERLLVLDATLGQNALSQARLFNEAVPLTGIALTKLDGTGKGGIIVPIAQELHIPVKLIGVGESADDLRDFVADEFVEALF
ncbi:MAG TPA: signal recognition particle-docking protein FtsY [Candidatus Fraserbacteria bacterium]|nr:signal recognition particle-docking protein FtsY [Candidatus Fraserbacteria bacterium]